MKLKQIAGMNQNYRQYTYDYFLESMKIAGYQSIELWLGAPHIWVDSQDYHCAKEILKQTNRAGLEIVSVTTPSGGAFQYQYGAQESLHMKKSIAYFKNGVRMTAELNARIMTANSGWGYWNEDAKQSMQRTIEILGNVCKEAEKLDVLIALESLTKNESLSGYTINQVDQIVKEVGSKNLKVMIDLDAIRFARETSTQWFERFGKELIHYHFQDGDYTIPSEGHYVWGDGEFYLEKELEIIKKYHFEGILTQEICGSMDPRLDDIRNMRVLQKMVDE